MAVLMDAIILTFVFECSLATAETRLRPAVASARHTAVSNTHDLGPAASASPSQLRICLIDGQQC